MKKQVFKISGMSCTSCAQTVEKLLGNTEGVEEANVNFPLEKAFVKYDPSLVSEKILLEKIAAGGFTAKGLETEEINGAKETKQEQEDYKEELGKMSLKISGMSCASCAQGVEKALKSINGVEEVNVNFASQKAQIKYQPQQVNTADFIEVVRKAGYEAEKEEEKKKQ